MIFPDEAHCCPVCGAWWSVERAWPGRPGTDFSDHDQWFVPEGSGWCSDPDCTISDQQRDEYRAFRRLMGWDPTEESLTRTGE